MIVDTKPNGHEVARWIQITPFPGFITIVLCYTDRRSGAYMRRLLGMIRTLGM